MSTEQHHDFLIAAIDEAEIGRDEGGLPIGSVLVFDGAIIGRGHNLRVQRQDFGVILHAEMACFANAGRANVQFLCKSTLYTTLAPCDMCTGTSLLYRIPKIVVGATTINHQGNTWYDPTEQIRYLRERGVELILASEDDRLSDAHARCERLMTELVSNENGRRLWLEDIGRTK